MNAMESRQEATAFFNRVQELRKTPMPLIDGETFEQWHAKKTASDYAKLPLTLWIEESAVGDSKPFQFETLNQASAAFRAFTRDNDLGGSGCGRCVIRKGFDRRGPVVAHVSFNGRVWAGAPHEWNNKTALLMDVGQSKSYVITISNKNGVKTHSDKMDFEAVRAWVKKARKSLSFTISEWNGETYMHEVKKERFA
jgi:hypothetical protein